MEMVSTIMKDIEMLRVKSASRKQFCQKHQLNYLFSCTECDQAKKKRLEGLANIQRLLSQSGIKKRFKNASFSQFKVSNDEDKHNLDLAKKYAKSFNLMKEKGVNIVMTGAVGNGKTYLAISIMQEVIKQNYAKAKIITAYELINQINETYSRDNPKTERQVKDEFLSYDLLVIDEIDINRAKDSDYLQLFNLLNERYEEMLPTIVISNLNHTELNEFVGERMMSRLLDGSMSMKFSGHDKRKITAINGGV